MWVLPHTLPTAVHGSFCGYAALPPHCTGCWFYRLRGWLHTVTRLRTHTHVYTPLLPHSYTTTFYRFGLRTDCGLPVTHYRSCTRTPFTRLRSRTTGCHITTCTRARVYAAGYLYTRLFYAVRLRLRHTTRFVTTTFVAFWFTFAAAVRWFPYGYTRTTTTTTRLVRVCRLF